MICIICGNKIKNEQPIPISEIVFTPIVPYVPGITPAKLGETILRDRMCCRACYGKVLKNDYDSIYEAGQINADKS